MSGPSSGGASSRGSSLGSPGPLADEREFDRLCSTIPDSQLTNGPMYMRTPPKKFSAAREEISESALSAGFMFAAKAPPRPGQFSQRPNLQVVEDVGLDLQSRQKSSPPQVTRPRPPQDRTVRQERRAAAPLDLPELGLPGNSSFNDSPPQLEVVRSDVSVGPDSFFHHVPLHASASHTAPKSVSKSSPSVHGELGRPSRPQPPQFETEGEPTLPKLPFQNVGSACSTNDSSPVRDQTLSVVGSPHVVEPQANERRLQKLKLPLPHVVQVGQARGRGTPSSACGDLERPAPAPRTPRTHHLRPHEFPKSMLSRPLINPRQYEQTNTGHSRRSESAASNISRRRSTIRKQRSQRDPERKKNAMQQVAEYWNECMRIAEDERDDANWEIDRLQREMRQQEEKLTKSLQLLSEKDVQLQTTQAQYTELKNQGSQVTTENKQLSGEVGSLRDQLEDSQKRTASLGGKFRTYRAKLNEAIAEQQALFLRSRTFYQEAQQELQKEKISRAVHAREVDKALDASRQKRDEMKQCFQEFRMETERECQKKDRFVSDLESNLRQQEEKITQERDVAAALRHRIEEQGKIQESIENVESQIQTLLEASAKKEEQDRKTDDMALKLSSKLDSIMEQLKSSAENTPPAADPAPIMQDVEQKIVSRLLPAILTVVSRQNGAEESLSQLRDYFQDNLHELRSDIKLQNEKASQDRENEERSREELVEFFSRIEDESTTTRHACEQTERQIREWAENHQKDQNDTINSAQDQITQQLKARESKIAELELKLQLMTENYASQIHEMKKDILESNEEAKAQLQATVSAIQDTLDKRFEEERASSIRSLSQSEITRAKLEVQLNEVQKKLEVASDTRENTDATGFQLREEQQAIVANLEQKIKVFELEAKATENLRDKWRRDVQAIDALRDQLKSARERVPRIETLGDSLKKMMSLSQMISSTSEYLVTERSWVNQQLDENATSGTQSASSTDTLVTELCQGEVGDAPKAELTSTVQSEATSTEVPSNLVNVLQMTGSQADEIEARRKVLVHSPAVNALSPSPPLSIQMEKQRRREAMTPRSILKPPKSSSQQSSGGETQGEAQQPIKAPLNHSQYNRPVVAKVSVALSSVNNEMIEQIRSSLLQPQPTKQCWNLPTVADFEKKSQLSSSQSDTVEKKHTILATEIMKEGPAKRIKIEEDSARGEVVETPEIVSQMLELQAKRNTATGRPILRTYSRMPSA